MGCGFKYVVEIGGLMIRIRDFTMHGMALYRICCSGGELRMCSSNGKRIQKRVAVECPLLDQAQALTMLTL